MWSKVALLCLIAATAFTSDSNPAWKDNTEYIYTVRGRTLTSLDELSDQFSGIQLKSKLHITLKSNGKIQGRISEPQYAQIHSHLPAGWDQTIPDSELNYKQLSWTDKPFEIEMENGLIRALIVEKEFTNWEVNMIKSVASQFQLDLQGHNAIESPINIRGREDNAVFKTMEETITGKTETTYNIHELREYYMQTQPELVPQRQLKGDGYVIEVLKSKNFTNSYERPSYHFGLKDFGEQEPTGNSVEDFLTRTSDSRVILTGKLSRFAIQSIYTVDKILVSPTWNQANMGLVVSSLNITLYQVQTRSNEPQELSNPITVGDLVYTYENPSSAQIENKRYGSEESSEELSEEHMRYRRFAPQMIQKLNIERREQQLREQEQPTPKMEYAPELPLLPYFIGYHGKSIKESGSFDLKQQVKKIAQDISKELQDSETILKEATLSKYTILASLLRLMNQEELDSVAEEIFSQQGQKDLWIIFRDAVAETGTGPAFLTIKKWIETKKIQHEEAGYIVATMASSVRTPTEEYMRKFFELVRSNDVVSQYSLNETSLLSYTSLVYQVYVNKNVSHNQYPVHSFGKFRSEEGVKFVKETIIPYLTQKLDQAVLEADTRKIHVYIRALGNVGYKHILPAFEKYLEGKKQCSHFQRLMMVISLDKLAVAYPEIARAVAYRIYQNSGELQQIRVAAVYLIMRTNPPKEMIQHMAQQTYFDKQQEVNAAVKSAIENLCKLRSPRHEQLRQAGESAKHLLNKKVYGYQNYMKLKDLVAKGFDEEIVYHVHSMTKEESNWPNAFKFALNKNMNDVQFFNIESMVSSVKEFVDVLEQQTEFYQEQQQNQQGGQKQFSSYKIAQMLNLDVTQKEQLEGFIYSEMGVLSRIFSFDNRSLEMLPEYIRRQEEIFKNGKEFSYTKMGHVKELALSFPTLMGLPFLYTLDMPMLMKVQGKTKMAASPAFYKDNKIVRPDEISGEIETEITLMGKAECHLSFITPFDHQQYFAGYNRNFQFHVPIKSQMKFDLKNKNVKIEIDTSRLDERRMVHFSSWPYTSRSDIMTTIPVALRPNTQYIKQQKHRQYDVVIGEKTSGIALRVWGKHEPHSVNFGELAHTFRTQGLMSVWQQLIRSGHMEACEFNIAALPEKSSTKKVTLYFNHQYKYVKSGDNQNEDVSQWFNEDFSEQSNRQKQMLKLTSSGLKSAEVTSCDMFVDFSQSKQYSITLGIGKSNVNPRSNVFAYLRKFMGQKLEQAAFKIKAEIPNTNALNMIYAMENEPKAMYEYQLFYQNAEQKKSEIQGKFEMKRSEERKQWLLEQPEYKQCKREIQQGENYQMHACLNMTVRANFFDKFEMKMVPKNLNEKFERIVKELYSAAKVYFFPSITVKRQEGSQDESINMQLTFQPDFEYVNVTVQTKEEKTKIEDIKVNHMLKPIFMAHPVFHLKSRFFGRFVGLDHFRRSCVVDKTAARTFNGFIYPVSSLEDWTVMMQYVPKQAKQQKQTVEQQLKKQVENFIVLNRKNGEQKEFKMVFNAPETQGKEVEITMTGSSSGAPTVKVDDQVLRLSKEEMTDDLYNGYVQIYLLPNNEVKIELQNVFYIIFDGHRARLTTLSHKFRNSVVGLCGRNSDDVHIDMLTPQNCVVAQPEEFIASFKASQQSRKFEDQKQCIPVEYPLFVDVISSEKSYLGYEQKGTKLQTRYIEDGEKICFTTRPVPVCKHEALSTIPKEVPVHCVENTRTAQLFKKQIKQGGSPDFSQKQVTKTMRFDVDQQCA